MKKIISILSSTLLLTGFSCGMPAIEGHDDMEFTEKEGSPFSNGFSVGFTNENRPNEFSFRSATYGYGIKLNIKKQVDIAYFTEGIIVETKIINNVILLIKEDKEIVIDMIGDKNPIFTRLLISEKKNIIYNGESLIIYDNYGNILVEQRKSAYSSVLLKGDKILFMIENIVYHMDINSYEVTEIVSLEGEEGRLENQMFMTEDNYMFSIIKNGNKDREIYDLEGNLKVEGDPQNDNIPGGGSNFCYVNDDLYVFGVRPGATFQKNGKVMTKGTGSENDERYKTIKYPVGCTSEALIYVDDLYFDSLTDIKYYEFAL